MNAQKKEARARYSEAQERIIKARFHRWLLHTHGGLWKRASADVFAHTGVAIPAETLRQNIEPVSKKAGLPPRRFTDQARLEALKDFLIGVKFLYAHELDETGPSSLVASALSDFLNWGGVPDARQWEQFKGSFSGARYTREYTELIEVQIEYAAPDKPVRVTEFSQLDYPERSDLNDQMRSDGWAVCNEHGFYMLLLRDALTAKCYLVLQTTPPMTGDAPVEAIAVVAYESAFATALEKTVTTIPGQTETVGYRLQKPVDDLCVFLTRT